MTQRNRVHPVETFSGFERPEDNFNRAPNSWFDAWIWVRNRLETEMNQAAAAKGEERAENDTGADRITGLLKCMIYIIKHTFGVQNYTQPIRLSANDIRNGRPKYHGAAPDQGVGLNPKTIASALERLHELGLITLTIDSSDPARVTKRVLPRIAPGTAKGGALGAVKSGFAGFDDPRANYWIQPDLFTDLIRPLKKATTILGTQYLFRHSWSWYGPDGFRDIWVGLSADEIANGKYMRNADGSFARNPKGDLIRLDGGIGYTVRNVHSGMAEAVEAGLVVYRMRANPVSLLEEREYLLRRSGWPEGQWQSAPATPKRIDGQPSTSEEDQKEIKKEAEDVNTRGRDVITRGRDDVDRGDAPLSRDVNTRGKDVIAMGKDDDTRGKDVNASRTYKPTFEPTFDNPPPATHQIRAPDKTNTDANQTGGGGLSLVSLFSERKWNRATQNGFVVTVDLLRHVGFSKQTALKLSAAWVETYKTEAPYLLAKWMFYHETSPGLDPTRRTGFIRVRLEKLEDPPQNISPPPEHEAMRFLNCRFEASESSDRPDLLPYPSGWWKDAETRRIEKERQDAEEEAARALEKAEKQQIAHEQERAARAAAKEELRAAELAQQQARMLAALRQKHCLSGCEPEMAFLSVWDEIASACIGARWQIRVAGVEPDRTQLHFQPPVSALSIARFMCEAQPALDAALQKGGWGGSDFVLPYAVEEADVERWLTYREMVDDYAVRAANEGRIDRLTVRDLPRLWPRSFDPESGQMTFKEHDVARKDKGRVGSALIALLSPVFGVAIRVEWV